MQFPFINLGKRLHKVKRKNMVKQFVSMAIFLPLLAMAQIHAGSYKQDIAEMIGPDESVHSLQRIDTSIIATTPSNLLVFENNEWQTKATGGPWVIDEQDSAWPVLVAMDKKLVQFNRDGIKPVTSLELGSDEQVSALLATEATYVGTNKALYRFDDSGLVPVLKKKKVRDLLKTPDGRVYAATDHGLWILKDQKWLNLDGMGMAPGWHSNYLSLAYGGHPAGVILGSTEALGCIADNGAHWMHSKGNGLPFGAVNKIIPVEKELWIATPKGACTFSNGEWHYYAGKRYLPHDHVHDILPVSKNRVWVATEKGIAEIRRESMTLEEKAKRFEQRILERHNRYGLVANSRLTRAGDLSTNVMRPNDNDGLWTAIYLGAQCFRYAVTGEQDAKQNAIRAFEAMERLETITPISGFPARSYVRHDEDTDGRGEWHATADGEWKWKGDTSSDEIVGHMFAYPLFHDLVATGEMKQRARDLIDRIMTYIVDNDFLLVDLDGNPTRWGVWNPDSLNETPDWRYERGLNSLQILAFLTAAERITGDEKYRDAYHLLIEKYGYGENMRWQKMVHPYEINHSDDELAFLPYYTLLRYTQDHERLPVFRESLIRSWRVNRPEKNPLWNAIASATLNHDCDMAGALETLQAIPMDLVDWRMENSHRWDLRHNPLSDRFGRAQAMQPVPIKERAVSKWNSNPYRLDDGGQGHGEDDGAYFLLPYWMARYYELIIEK
jgi:hypothetical protein